jgi:ABC-type branched-subunit amino acid transport system substrate-binding protein
VCSQTQQAAFELYGPDLGFEFVYLNDNVAFGMANGIGPEVTAMKDLGVDFISTCFDLNGMKTLAQELERQGMQDVVLQHPNTYNQGFVDEAGGLFDGDYVAVSFAAFEYDTGLEAQEKFIEYMEKQGTDRSELAMTGWINAALAFDGLLAAGPEFDRASVVSATNELTAWSADGLVVPIDWSRQHTGPTNADRSTYYEQLCTSIVKIEDGAFTPIGPADKPFLCWPGRSTEWAEPVPMSFG